MFFHSVGVIVGSSSPSEKGLVKIPGSTVFSSFPLIAKLAHVC